MVTLRKRVEGVRSLTVKVTREPPIVGKSVEGPKMESTVGELREKAT